MANSLPGSLQRCRLDGIRDTGITVGDGAFATVLQYDFRGLKCAGKKIHHQLYEHASPAEKDDMLRRFGDECELLSQLHHPNVVQFLGIHKEMGSELPVLVMEYLPTNLSGYLDRHGVLPIETGYGILRDVAVAMRYLHEYSPPIVHRDLSANNVLLTASLSAKISDLGVAKILSVAPSQIMSTKVPGTPCYMPPEALVDRPRYTRKIDSYSFGVLILHVLCGEWPFPTDPFQHDPHNPGTIVPVTEVDRRAEFLQQLGGDHLLPLVCQCLSNTPDERPESANILQYIDTALSRVPAPVETVFQQLGSRKSDVERLRSETKRVRILRSEDQPDPKKCTADGHGLHYGQTRQRAQFQVHLMNANGEPCVERQKVTAELVSLVDDSIAQAMVKRQAEDLASYEVSYELSIRGRHELRVEVNGLPIADSPFIVYVQVPPDQLDPPVAVIGGLMRPWGATCSNSGQVVVSSFGKISLYANGRLLQHEVHHSGGKLDLRGVAIDDSGNMYVCDRQTHKLFKIRSDGIVLKSVGSEGKGPEHFNAPDGIAIRNNTLYVCDYFNYRIQILTSGLEFIKSFGRNGNGVGEFAGPSNLAFDQDGNMYVVEDSNARVQVFSPSDTVIMMFSTYSGRSVELSAPEGICVDHNVVYVTDWGSDCVCAFTRSGEFITSIERKPRDNEEEGEFAVVGITMDQDGYIYVCDEKNHCIQRM